MSACYGGFFDVAELVELVSPSIAITLVIPNVWFGFIEPALPSS